jgi:MerR family transcriptional regulator/heat shock protein HspR
LKNIFNFPIIRKLMLNTLKSGENNDCFNGIILVFIDTGMKKQDKNTPTLLIGDVAEKLGISPESIRLYDRMGLVVITKTKGNQRLFSQSDMERLECIRTAINEHKISIEGIRRIQSLVPCWEHIKCPVVQREKCPAYHRSDAGCWTYKHKQNNCADRECRNCRVYQLSGDCEKIKSLIHTKAIPLPKRHMSRG